MTTLIENDQVTGDYVSLDGELYYRITDSHLMPDFFMSLVGASDHWMFISSNGALTAGRRNADLALFPYGSDDQISAKRSTTGSTTLIRAGETALSGGDPGPWEPFAPHSVGVDSVGAHRVRRNLYKTPLGNKLVFEEINETLQLVFRYRWTFSEQFGFVRSCRLENLGHQSRALELLDGLRNILPYGVGSDFQMRFSNLANAYKKSELIAETEIGLFYLSSIPTDRAEPSEGLQATTVWHTGLRPDAVLISSEQLGAFRRGDPLQTEHDVRGKAGAFLLHDTVELAAGSAIEWHIIAEIAQDHADIIGLDEWLPRASDPAAEVASDVEAGQQNFLRIVSSSDGLQCGSNRRRCNRHLSNTVFNVMRGGIPLQNYRVNCDDFLQHLAGFNRETYRRHRALIEAMPPVLDAADLLSRIEKVDDPDLTRVGLEFLPLAFSRRHGDPTRPWNQFAINLRSASGRTNLNYQGNWRDIFQNWEALALSFPDFSTSMICRFVNATTADGYNPYRLTKDGFEWEEPEPDDPWANIGYWGDHQIVYLLKLLEWNRRFDPERLGALLNSSAFVHANVPYRIKDFEEIKKDPRSTIDFDTELSAAIGERTASIGADGKLLRNQQNEIHYVTLLEKLLTLSLAKLSNFVPDGGIWLNTQRPEWNDANNALVGNGLSMVTACYLRRWFVFLNDWISSGPNESFQVSQEVADFFHRIKAILQEHAGDLGSVMDSRRRFRIVEALSKAGSDYRNKLYQSGPSGQTSNLATQECLDLFGTASEYLECTIANNKRPGGLFHSYNLLDWRDDSLEIEHLYEMLEGQVAALSSGLLTATESVQLLDALRQSALYRENQDSYLLYPDRQLPRFLDKNRITNELLECSPLLQRLLADDNVEIVRRDVRGEVHFNGSFRNSADLRAALDRLDPKYESVVRESGSDLTRMFEEIFGHRQFTGRSGTFFGYEGLGSIYWHMVSKLAYAVSENFFWAIESGASEKTVASLGEHFQSIRQGIGAEKSPADYGAFPSDPYSHTPENAGVKQPGMTGQVKEDILSRFSEIGVDVLDGCVCFRLALLDRSELVEEPCDFTFCNLAGEFQTVRIPEGGFGFTLCQVPFIFQAGDADTIRIRFCNGADQRINGLQMDQATSRKLLSRCGEIESIECQFTALRHE